MCGGWGVCVHVSDVEEGVDGSEKWDSSSTFHPWFSPVHDAAHLPFHQSGPIYEFGTNIKTTTKNRVAWSPNTLLWKFVLMVRSFVLGSG